MKTLVIFFSIITSLAGIPAAAQTIYATDKTPVIFAQIQKSMRVPATMKNKVSSERVRVVFTIDEKGQAHVVEVCTRRPELKGSVTSQFEAIDFSAAADNGTQQYSIWLNFNVL